MSRLLKVKWAKGDPQMKLTALRDVGRQTPFFLHLLDARDRLLGDSNNKRAAPPSKKGGEGEGDCPEMPTCLGTVDAANPGPLPPPPALFETQNLPPLEELKLLSPAVARSVCLSLQRWVGTLGYVQDQLIRKRLPFVESQRVRRAGKTLQRLEVYPTRNWERIMDWTRSGSVLLATDLVEQTPSPLVHDTTLDVFLQRHEKTGTAETDGHIVKRNPRTVRKLAKIAEAKEEQRALLKAAAEEEKRRLLSASRDEPEKMQQQQQLDGERAEEREEEATAEEEPRAKSAEAASTSQQASADDATTTSELLTIPNYQHLSEARHGGSIEAQRIFVGLQRSNIRSDVDVRNALCLAHASILSTLFVHNRAVAFFTDSSLIATYLRCVFAHLIAEQMISVEATSDKPVDASVTEEELPPAPFVKPTALRNPWVVMPPAPSAASKTVPSWSQSSVDAAAELIVRCCVPEVHIDTTWPTSRAIAEAVESKLKARWGDELAKERCAVEWRDVRTSYPAMMERYGSSGSSASDDGTTDALEPAMTFLVDDSTRKTQAFRDLAEGFAPARLVGVNVDATDAMLSYPMLIGPLRRAAGKQAKKVNGETAAQRRTDDPDGAVIPFLGGCYRYVGVERSLLEAPLCSDRSLIPPLPTTNPLARSGIAIKDQQMCPALSSPRANEVSSTEGSSPVIPKLALGDSCEGVLLHERLPVWLFDSSIFTLVPVLAARFGL